MDKDNLSYGIYRIENPLFFFFKPKLFLSKDKKDRPQGAFKWFKLRVELELLKVQDSKVIFRIPVGVFYLEVVLDFQKDGYFEGILDMPIGNIKFTGRKIGACN